MGVALMAVRSFSYAGKAIRAGSVFTARTQADAIVLTQVGHARIPSKSKRVESDPEPEQPESEPRARRSYRRRDLTADAE